MWDIYVFPFTISPLVSRETKQKLFSKIKKYLRNEWVITKFNFLNIIPERDMKKNIFFYNFYLSCVAGNIQQ